MTISVRMDSQLLQRLRDFAAANGISASAVVREALEHYLSKQHASERQPSAWELGANLFGRHGSGNSETSRREVRKAHVRARVHRAFTPSPKPPADCG